MTTNRNGERDMVDQSRAKGTRLRWTKSLKDAFLDELAASCNVRESAVAIGVEASNVYALRRRDEAFTEAWQAALAQGYQMLETQLVGHALAGGGATLTNGDPARPPIDVELAVRLLADHRSQAGGGRRVGGARPKFATRADTNAAILKRLKTIEGRLGLPPLPPAEPGGPAEPATAPRRAGKRA